MMISALDCFAELFIKLLQAFFEAKINLCSVGANEEEASRPSLERVNFEMRGCSPAQLRVAIGMSVEQVP